MNCPNCGAYIGEQDVFCGECGRPVERTPEEVKDLPTAALNAAPALPPRPSVAPPAGAAPATPAAKRPNRGVLLGLVGTLAGVLCLCIAGVALWIAVDDGATPTAEVVVVTPAPGVVLYEESFQNPDSGWDVYNNGDTLALYQDGEYRLGVFRTDYVAWGNPAVAQDLGDFEIEVDARAVEGPLDNNLGVLVRYQDDDEGFYWFQISSDGFFAVDRLDGEDWVSIEGWQESDAIRQGLDATNRLKVTCSGDEFVFYVNDTWLTAVTDAALASGSVGLAAGSFGEAGVVVHFDNLRVYGVGK